MTNYRQQLADDAERLLRAVAGRGEVTGEDVITIRDLISIAWRFSDAADREKLLGQLRAEGYSPTGRLPARTELIPQLFPPDDGSPAAREERRDAKARRFRELYGAGPRPGAGLVIHPLNRPGAPRRNGWTLFWQRAGFTLASTPADDSRPHPYGRSCPFCSEADPPDCDHGLPGRRHIVNGQCRRCGEDVYRSLGSTAGMRTELDRRGAGFGSAVSVRDLARFLDITETPEP